MSRFVYGVLILLCYSLLYWVLIGLWSFTGLAHIGRVAEQIDFALRITVIPFIAGGCVAFLFRNSLQIWALAVAPLVSSAGFMFTNDMTSNDVKAGMVTFLAISGVAACASVVGGVIERRVQLAQASSRPHN